MLRRAGARLARLCPVCSASSVPPVVVLWSCRVVVREWLALPLALSCRLGASLGIPWGCLGGPGFAWPLPLGHVLYSPLPALSSPAPWVCSLSLPGCWSVSLALHWSCCLASPLPRLLGRTCGADGRLFVHCV
ncbi:hypothetical protein 20Aug401_00022 [Pseudomonas phage 20Aug401]|uniref:Uncharacterized protein n=1 Tax=Pseudomonas phage 20Aug401 TaxID=3028482 RepID=A0AAF0FLE9_9CAUD|nr:hypothetical protein 20Aug401_00022 [Pseudomonas phage 20Aug401]